ncbi:MAG: lmo0937 family membrane protein [Candidatus Methylomirabilis sp.]|nr:lmo0937 family membrane protein [Deltaproteobacteria bacterium]
MDLLWTIAAAFLALWALGLVSGHVIGGCVHALLVIAVALALVRVIHGRRRLR